MGVVSYALILLCFFVGYYEIPKGMHMGEWLYVMLALFVLTILYSVYTTVVEIRYHRKIIEDNTTEDLLPFDGYTYASYTLMGILVLAMAAAICYRPLLYSVAPLMLLALISFVVHFLGFGYIIMPTEVRLEMDTADAPFEMMEESEGMGLDSEKIAMIESLLDKWCENGGYRNSTVNMPMLSAKLRIPRSELSFYFENYLKSSFRTWLSDIRFKEAQRMLLEESGYSNDTISTECGFSSHAHLYKIFKTKTGYTPGQWRDSVRKMQ